MTRRTPFRTCLLSAALLLAVTGCRTTIVEHNPAPEHHDDHQPPPPDHHDDHHDDRPDHRG